MTNVHDGQQDYDSQPDLSLIESSEEPLFDGQQSLLPTAIVRGEDFCLRWANRSFLTLLGELADKDQRSCRGASWKTLFPWGAGKADPLHAAMLAVAATGQATEMTEHRVWRPDGEVGLWRIFITPMPLPVGSPDILLHVVDLTSLMRHAEVEREALKRRLVEQTTLAERQAAQLRTLTGELARAERRERRRLAQFLHDHLQQLLVASRLKVSLLRRHVGDDRLREWADEVDGLINQAISQSRCLTTELNPTVLQQEGLTAAFLWLAGEMWEKYSLRISIAAEREAEPLVEDVKTLLFEAVRELLFNVVKHAYTKQALVQMSLDNPDLVRLVVADEGAGFEPSRLTAPATASYGFGLSSIRERLELIGARLEVESAPGKGTRNTILVPRHPRAKRRRQRPVSGAAAKAANAAEKIRVLIVDDHAIVRQGLASLLLEEADMKVVGEAGDGEEAVALAAQLHPDVVLMDIVIPKLDGIEATKRITGQLPAVQVIGLTMHQDEGVAAAFLAAGGSEYLVKAGPAEVLVNTIRRLASPGTNERT